MSYCHIICSCILQPKLPKAAFMSGFASSGFSVGSTGYGGFVGRTTIMSIVGGTASAIAGGDFKNGAMTGAFVHMFNAENDTLSKGLKRLWSKKGEITSDAWRGLKGGAQGLHKIMTMDPSQVKGGLIGQGLYEGLTLRMGAGNGSSYGYERNIAPLVITRQIAYTNPLVLDTATTVGLGDMFSIKSEEK